MWNTSCDVKWRFCPECLMLSMTAAIITRYQGDIVSIRVYCWGCGKGVIARFKQNGSTLFSRRADNPIQEGELEWVSAFGDTPNVPPAE